MNLIFTSAAAFPALVTLGAYAMGIPNRATAATATDTTTAAAGESGSGLLIGGCGGVYFLAEPGELIVDVCKRDRNVRGRHTDLRAILVGPDRNVLAEATIPALPQSIPVDPRVVFVVFLARKSVAFAALRHDRLRPAR